MAHAKGATGASTSFKPADDQPSQSKPKVRLANSLLLDGFSDDEGEGGGAKLNIDSQYRRLYSNLHQAVNNVSPTGIGYDCQKDPANLQTLAYRPKPSTLDPTSHSWDPAVQPSDEGKV
jgi:hypothetical protein